jgi:hypothetical protein
VVGAGYPHGAAVHLAVSLATVAPQEHPLVIGQPGAD